MLVADGLKATTTALVCPPAKVNGLPLTRLNPDPLGMVTEPVKLKLPRFMAWNGRVLVRPITTPPKFWLAGVTSNLAGALVTLT